MITEKILDKAMEDIKYMSKEEFESKVLKLNGKMTQELFDKVINEIILKKDICQENLLYNEDKYNITLEEFNDVYNYISAKHKDKSKSSIESIFPEYLLYFKYNNNIFCHRLGIGQGAYQQILLCESCSYILEDNTYDIEIKDIDTTIKFYKHIN